MYCSFFVESHFEDRVHSYMYLLCEYDVATILVYLSDRMVDEASWNNLFEI